MAMDRSDGLYARVNWNAESQPISAQFDDFYFSTDNGLEESRYVFLEQNQLEKRWKALADAGATTNFVVAETGFGTGLNFLATWQLWQKAGPQDGWLHFISAEKYPLTTQDLKQALALWPELKPLADQLVQQYPAAVTSGYHRLTFHNTATHSGGVKLTLIIDDATVGYQAMQKSQHPAFNQGFNMGVDAWFLDGFSPTRNPDIWTEDLFTTISNLSKKGTTLATFTSARVVKEGLSKAGFSLHKISGYGKKREMLSGALTSPPERPNAEDYNIPKRTARYPVPWDVDAASVQTTPSNVVIIGGGIAGSLTAYQLAVRGINSTIIESKPQLAEGASGNRQGILYAKLSLDNDWLAQYNLSSLQYALRFYLPLFDSVGQQCGVFQLSQNDGQQKIHEQLAAAYGPGLVDWLSANNASKIAGQAIDKPALYFPKAGWINPVALCQTLTMHPLINILTNSTVTALKHAGHQWQALDHNGQVLAQAEAMVIANAADAMRFSQTKHLPLKPIRGQVTHLASTAESSELKAVLCGEGYVAPSDRGLHTTGATFNLKSHDPDLRPEDHQQNLNNLERISPTFAANWQGCDTATLQGRVGFRCTTPDYMPLVGQAPEEQAFDEDFARLRRHAHANIPAAGRTWPNLFVNVGFGSRGLTYAPLACDYLVGLMTGEPLPIPAPLARSLHPGRFLIRQLMRNKR